MARSLFPQPVGPTIVRCGCCFTFFSLRGPRPEEFTRYRRDPVRALYNKNEGFGPPGLEVGERKSYSMNRLAKTVLLALCLFVLSSGLGLAQPTPATPGQSEPDSKASEKAAAYYNFALGHLYADLAGAFGN